MASLNSALTAPAANRPVALNYQLTMAFPRVSNDRNPAEKSSFYLSFLPKGIVYFERSPEQWENWGNVPRKTYSPHPSRSCPRNAHLIRAQRDASTGIEFHDGQRFQHETRWIFWASTKEKRRSSMIDLLLL